jgi:hypothetical protein
LTKNREVEEMKDVTENNQYKVMILCDISDQSRLMERLKNGGCPCRKARWEALLPQAGSQVAYGVVGIVPTTSEGAQLLSEWLGLPYVAAPFGFRVGVCPKAA